MLDFLSDFWQYMKHRKKWFLIPVIVILILMGALIILSSGSAIGTAIYTLF